MLSDICYIPFDSFYILLFVRFFIGQKSQILPTPSHLAPSFGMISFKFIKKSYAVPETRVFQAAGGEDLVILSCTVFD